MNITDILIVAILLVAARQGVRMGLFRQVAISACMIIGLFLCAFAQSFFAGRAIADSNVFVGLLLLLTFLILALFFDIGNTLGEYLVRRLDRFRSIALVDGGGGLALGVLTAVVLVWLWSALFVYAPAKPLASQMEESVILTALRKEFPVIPQFFANAGNIFVTQSFPQIITHSSVLNGPKPSVDMTQMPTIQQAADAAADSVVLVQGKGCGGIRSGTGFVAGTNLLVTNAHVVAGITSPMVVDVKGEHAAHVAYFNPWLDLAVLRVNDLAGKPLEIKSDTIKKGTNGVVMGYATGTLKAGTAVAMGQVRVTSYDIYGTGRTDRDIYAVYADVQPGDSGGPMINKDGQVIGVVFGKSTSKEHTGYLLTMSAVVSAITTAQRTVGVVNTGVCSI